VKLEPGKKAATKCIKLHGSAINFIAVATNKYFITGGADGIVKVFDFNVHQYIKDLVPSIVLVRKITCWWHPFGCIQRKIDR
jgi:hypothetical protein